MKSRIYGAIALTFVSVAIAEVAHSEDRYDYCRDRARDISGYYGPIPAEYKRSGGALKGAFKGAAAGAALGWVSGGDTKKAAKRGAALGALAGGIKKAKQDKKRRKNKAKRRQYEVELHACMDSRRKR